MSKEEEKILSEIQTKVKEYEKLQKEKEEKKKEKSKYVTKDDLLKELLNQINQDKPVAGAPTKVIQPQQMQQQGIIQPQQMQQQGIIQPQQMQPKPMSEKQQIAFQLWKDAKATSLVCLIAILLPLISILITMMPDGTMYALVIVFAGIVYPCFILVRMIGLQTKLYQKYGLKPLLQFRQQYQMPYQQGQTKNNKGDMML